MLADGAKRGREGEAVEEDGAVSSKKAKGMNGGTSADATSPSAKPAAKVQTQLSFGGLVEVLWTHPFPQNDTLFCGITRDAPKPSAKIAGIDLDGTLISTKSGLRHSRDASDWRWFDPKVPAKVRQLHADGFRIVIFTNQGGMKSQKPDSSTIMGFKNKFRQIATQLKVPLTLLAATNYDKFRKPDTGMMEYLLQELNGGVEMDKSKSFYVGDAAGRTANWKPRMTKDFSDSDRKFAMNAGIAFHTPEAFFKDEQESDKWTLSGFDPRPYKDKTFEPRPADFFKPSPIKQELVIFVGRPGSGKTTVARTVFSKYTWINQDTLKSRDKCVHETEEELRKGRSVVVDNTNPARETRSLYIELARMRDIPVRCIWFTASEEVCVHNSNVRASVDPTRKSLPKMAWSSYAANYQEPKVEEGFKEVLKVDFEPDLGGDERLKEKWFKFTSSAS